jgi:hypothetical protein
MLLRPPAQINRKADIIQLRFVVEGADAMPLMNVTSDDLLMLFKQLPGGIFEILADRG